MNPPSLWTRPAPATRHAVRHERRESGWCTVDPEVLALAARDDERRHAHRPIPMLWPSLSDAPLARG